MGPPSGLSGGSGRGDRAHRQLSAPDPPRRLTCVGTTPGALQGLSEGRTEGTQTVLHEETPFILKALR